MLSAQSPISGNQIQRPKIKGGRKPLQSKNSTPTPVNIKSKQQDVAECTDISLSLPLLNNSNKENIHPTTLYSTPSKTDSFKIEHLDASLADELTAIRRKLERLRLEKEKTDKILRDREMLLDMQMKELQNRGEVQKQLEIEVDRLYRLKEIRLSCMRISPIRSLREKENQKDEGRSVTGIEGN